MLKGFVAAAFAAVLIVQPATAQSPEASQGQDLSYCAGAVAAVGDLDVFASEPGEGEWGALLGRILERLNQVDGLEGMTGRYAASAAKGFWQEQPRAARTAAAEVCRQRYAS